MRTEGRPTSGLKNGSNGPPAASFTTDAQAAFSTTTELSQEPSRAELELSPWERQQSISLPCDPKSDARGLFRLVVPDPKHDVWVGTRQ